jgi:hypothetical protein
MWLKFKFQSFDFERTEGRLFQKKKKKERINKCDIYVFIYFIFFVPGPGKGQTTGPCHYPRKYTINV